MFLKKIPNIDDYLKRQLAILGWMLIFLGALLILFIVKPVILFLLGAFTPFIIAMILAYVFDPMVSVVQKKLNLPRFAGLIIFYAIILIIVSLLLLLILPELFKQTINIISSIKEIVPKKIEFIQNKYGIELNKETINEYMQKLNITQDTLKDAAGAMAPGLKKFAGSGISAAGNIAKEVASGIGYLFSIGSILMFVVIINFYFLMDFDKIKPAFEKFIPPEKLPAARDLMRKLDLAVGGFIRGQAIDCFIVGTLAAIGLFALGLGKYAILVGMIAGVGNAIPYLGPIMAGVPSALFILLSDSYSSIEQRLWYIGGVVILFAVIQTIDGLLLQPKIVGKNSQLHPLAVLLGLFVGAQFGFAGMIIAIPVACIVRVLILELIWQKITYEHDAEEPGKKKGKKKNRSVESSQV